MRFVLRWVIAVAALAVAPHSGFAQSAAEVRDELARTDRVLEQARSRGGDSLDVARLEQAGQLQQRARRALEAALFRDALRLTRAARERAVLDENEPARPRMERVHAALERTERILRRLREAHPELAPVGRDRLDRARALQSEARRALQAGRPILAGTRTLQARRLAQSALHRHEGAADERVGRLVDGVGELLEESDWLDDAGERSARAYEQAQRRHEQAVEELEQRRLRAAARQAQEARSLLLRALRQADRPIARDAVADAVRRSADRITAARGRGGVSERRFARAEEHQRAAERLLRAGRFPAALAEVHAVSEALERAGL